jgi:hypothetical protein
MAGGFMVEKWPDPTNPSQIRLVPVENYQPTPSEVAFSGVIHRDIDKLIRIAKPLSDSFLTDPMYKDCYERFFEAAEAGLKYPVGNLQSGKQALERARHHTILLIGRKRMNRFFAHIISVTVIELLISILMLTYPHQIGTAVRSALGDKIFGQVLVSDYVVSLGAAGIGNSIAVVLTNIWYLRELTWDKVDFLDPAGLPASIRVFGVWLLTVLLMILLATKVITIGIMNITLNDFVGKPGPSLLVGVLCGLSEVPVVGLIQRAFSRPSVTPQNAGC